MRFFVDGLEVTWEHASKVWHQSGTFRRANRRTRDQIWRDAMRGVDSGGVKTHLAEAGIRVEPLVKAGDTEAA